MPNFCNINKHGKLCVSGNHTDPTEKELNTINRDLNINNLQSHVKTYALNESSESSNQTNSSLAMLRDYLEVYETKVLIDLDELKTINTTFADNSTFNLSLTTEVTLCQNYFCCVFMVSSTN